jgi:HAE1 family hydrophobic/amphiphilic exporter-1
MLLALLTVGLGVYAAGVLNQELIPAFDLPRGSIVTVYSGATPQVVESEISQPIESAISSIAGITQVTSKSSSGVSQVSLQWEYGIDPDDMANDLRRAVDSVSARLPAGVDPQVITGSFDDIPILIVALSSSADPATLSQQAEDLVVPQLESLPGVREVTVAGEETTEVLVTYDQEKIQDLGVDPTTIAGYFAANSTAYPSGTMTGETANLDVQTGTTFAGIDDIKAIRVQGTDGPVELGDIAEVVEQPVESTTISRVNGKPSLTFSVTKESGGNTVSVAHAVNGLLPELESKLGNGAEFATVFDQAPYIEQSIHDLSVEGGIGLAMAVLVILLFLGSIRSTIITAISIPLSLVIALIGLYLSSYTLNILTLGALTVAIGRVVDDSIVVIENIKRHQGYGEFGRASIITAVKEVAGAVTSSTFTTVAVFLPIGLVGGQAGEIFRPFAVTVTIALLASLFVSLTVVPVLASWFMRPTAKQLAKAAATAAEPEKDTLLQKAYLPVLGWSLRHRLITVVLAIAVLAGTLALAPRLKTDFIGNTGQESLSITQKLPAGTSLAQTDAASRQIESVLAADPEVQTYQTTIGGSASLFLGGRSDTNQATFTVALKQGSTGTAAAARVRTAVADLGPEAGTVQVSVGTSSSSGVVVYVEGSDPEDLAAVNAQVQTMLEGIPDLTNVASDLTEAKQMLQVSVDRAAAAEQGMTQSVIGQAVARSVRGQQIGTLASGDSTLKVYLRSREPVSTVKELRNITLPVTQLMNANARTDAADKVTKRSKKLQKESKQSATDAYNDQVSTLRKNRTKAQQAVRTLQRNLNRAEKRVKQLRKELSGIPAQCIADPTAQDCQALPSGIFRVSQELSAAAMELAGYGSALAQTKASVTAIDKQLEALSESRGKTLEAQDKQQAITDASKDAAKATADPVRLKAVAEVSVVDAPNVITRVDGVRAATLTATSEGTDLGATTTAITNGIAALDLPDGVNVRIGGVSQQQQESFAQLGLAMLVAIAVVYLIMVATFGSLLQPLLLLVSIPFAATGAIGLSLLTDTPLGLPSMIGLLMLIGIVVTNAIVLIDLINQKRRAGAGVDESITAGARLRVRPIIMTALATVFALVPMSLGLTGGGVFISKPLAIVVIGGLASSTVLTLVLVPVLYDLLEKWRERRADRRAARGPSAAPEAA